MISAEKNQVAILAGGKGTRLRLRTGDIPKPMVPLLGKPLLQYHIELCKNFGFARIALLVHYNYEMISDYFRDGDDYGVKIDYIVEKKPRGTAGALRDSLHLLDERFIVLYGDTYIDVDLNKLWLTHKEKKADVTLFLHPNDHPFDSDLVEINNNNKVTNVYSYPHKGNICHRNLVNAALYVFNNNAQLENSIASDGIIDLAKNTFPVMLDSGCKLYSYISPEYIKDIGTPQRLDKVGSDILKGLPERLSSRHKRKAVFIDRDGTLNFEVNHLSSASQLTLLPGVSDAIHSINRSGVLAVAVTNQPVVARGDVTWDELNHIHATLEHLIGKSNAYLDRIYVCPHHPDRGFKGEVQELKIDCDCRKPKTGLIDQAVKDLNISRKDSWLIGDTTADIRAGKNAGLRTILVRTGYAGLDGKYPDEPDYVMPDLSAAVEWILRGHADTARQLMEVSTAVVKSKQRLILVGGPARAGKSCTARVLAEQLDFAGLMAHVISLDGWLHPVDRRSEGNGVLERYDIRALIAGLEPILKGGRHWLNVPVYERKSRGIQVMRQYSIGPDDLLIVEGVPALMIPALSAAADVCVYVDVDDKIREQRLRADYAWRGDLPEDFENLLRSREFDELPLVRESVKKATHTIVT